MRASATTCYLCGQPFTAADPPVADHIYPRGLFGGSDEPANLAAAHQSCNGRKVLYQLGNIGGLYPGGG